MQFLRPQQQRRGKASKKKVATSFMLSTCAVYLLGLQPSQMTRYLSSNQVDLSKFQIDSYPLIDSQTPTDEELIDTLKEIFEVAEDSGDFDEASVLMSIDQMFYMNYDKDIEKKQKMEDWLSWFLPNRHISFYRVPLLKGLPYVCAFDDEEKCIKESGKVDTLLYLMHSKKFKKHGVSLVLQDDVQVTDMHRLRLAANLVPCDWDVIRFDCPLESENDLPNWNNYAYQTNQGRKIQPFVDSSRVMLLRDDKFDKIAEAINVSPRIELDAALSWKHLNSYCVNVGIGNRFEIIKPRPVIYTFFSPVDEDAKHDDLIGLWKKEWELAGFEPRILTIEDAMKNPYFDTMKAEVEQVFKTDVYNTYCFYRYLAMANVGGIMTDYDTMPFHFPIEEAMGNTLVNDGKFTSYEIHVPSLISASREEWQHVAQLLTEQIPKSDAGMKTDMYLLKEVGDDESNDVDLWRMGNQNVMINIPYIKGEKQKLDCHVIGRKRAIHMSHRLTKEIRQFSDEYGLDDLFKNQSRTQIVEILMNDFREQCLGYGNVMEVQ